MLPAQADELGGSCTMYYSGVNVSRSCTYFSLPWLNSRLYMNVSGYAYGVVTCSGLQVANSGVVSSGITIITYVNPGGSCRLQSGVNGTLYVSAN